MRKFIGTALLSIALFKSFAIEDPQKLYMQLRDKVLSVKDYSADVKMKVDVSYMRVPLLQGKLMFKAPDKMKLERDGGLSILPKKNVNLTLSNLIPTGNVTVLDAGIGILEGRSLRILKVIPENDIDQIVLTKLWVDELNLLVLKTETTTQNDGTVIMSLEYGNYKKFALPDKVIVHMDLKDYKLPKGVTMDYGDDSKKKPSLNGKKQKGTIEILYKKYDINKGLSDAIFAN